MVDIYIFKFWMSYKTGVTGGAETGYPSEALEFTPFLVVFF
jgi:hypothetical protein